MAKPLPVPGVAPSAPGAQVIHALRAFAASPATTQAEYVQRVIDLQHVSVAVRDLMDPAYFAAVDPNGGGVSFRVMAQRTGLAKSAIQRRVDHGSTLPPLIPARHHEQAQPQHEPSQHEPSQHEPSQHEQTSEVGA